MLELSKRYPEKRAFISGAGSGFGAALSMQLATDGWRLGMTDINEQALAETARGVEEAGGTAQPYLFDVREAGDYQAAVEDFIAQTGGIDLLINNAGIGSGGDVGDVSLEVWRQTLDINLMGVVHGLHVALPAMKQAASGHVINVGSAASFAASPSMSPYNASKAAVLAITETLHTELEPYGIDVSCLMPLYVRTSLHETLIGTDEAVTVAHKLITRSEHTAADVARHTLHEAGKGELYIFFPKEARRLWRFKRLAPLRYFKYLLRMMKRYQ